MLQRLRYSAEGERLRRRPAPGVVRFVDNSIFRSWRGDLQGLEKLDQAVSLELGEGLKSAARRIRLAVMRQDRLAKRGEQAMMEERRLVRCAPKPLRQETTVAILD